jgi:hypothetical protein
LGFSVHDLTHCIMHDQNCVSAWTL